MTIEVHEIAKGNTLTPLGFKLVRGKTPVDLAGKTVKVFGKKDNGDAWIAETATGVTQQPTRTFTADADSDYLTDNDNKAANGDQIIVSSAGTLPTGLTANTRYFVRDREPNRFKLSLSPDGAVVDVTAAGTGAHSYYIVGSGQYDFQTADVASGGTFWVWVNVYDGSEYDTFPIVRNRNDRGLRVDIVEPA